ncbi:MAG: HU family DNA-binding protein [Okeania sp. SIO1H6]|nr:HU family DNA-binding protein [Okeania sp. SIO1H6]
MSINKKELIKRVSQQVSYDTPVVEEVINVTLDEIYQCLKKGESVSLQNNE